MGQIGTCATLVACARRVSIRSSNTASSSLHLSSPWYVLVVTLSRLTLLLQSIFIASAISYSPLTYEDETPYPWWGEMLGWFLALSSMLQVPLVAAYLIWKEKGSFAERVETLLQPKVTLFYSTFNDT